MNSDNENSQSLFIENLKENNLSDANQAGYDLDSSIIGRIGLNNAQNWNDFNVPNDFWEIREIREVNNEDPDESINEPELYFIKKKSIFKVIYPENSLDIFTNFNSQESTIISELKKRFDRKRKRFENSDNILKKIITAFLNRYLLNALNTKLRKIGSKLFFDKIPQNFLRQFINKTNKKNILKLSLKELFGQWNLFSRELKSLEKEERLEIKLILNSSCLELYQLYINSDEFNIKEINRLKEKNMDEIYINNYKRLSNDFIKF